MNSTDEDQCAKSRGNHRSFWLVGTNSGSEVADVKFVLMGLNMSGM